MEEQGHKKRRVEVRHKRELSHGQAERLSLTLHFLDSYKAAPCSSGLLRQIHDCREDCPEVARAEVILTGANMGSVEAATGGKGRKR